MKQSKFELFCLSLKDDKPSFELSPALVGLWYDGHGSWEAGHREVQKRTDVDSFWVHAYLHRKEGDLENAAYWYKRCDKILPSQSSDDEWRQIATVLISRQPSEKASEG